VVDDRAQAQPDAIEVNWKLADSASSCPWLSKSAAEQSSISLTSTAVADRIMRVVVCSAIITSALRTISKGNGINRHEGALNRG